MYSIAADLLGWRGRGTTLEGYSWVRILPSETRQSLVQRTDKTVAEQGRRRCQHSLMPLTRKQAWRKVRVRHEATEIYGEIAAAHNKRFGRGTRGRRHPSRREMERTVEPPRVPMPTGDSVDLLGTTHILEKRRLPTESRDSADVPGLNAARRQAAAPCVRVGSRVSFNTVVAAILIPSARDLQAAARRELWWQDTDYRDFRVNFLRFMRESTLTDDPEMIPLDVMSETGAPTAEECPGEVMQNSALQQVIVGAVMYKGTTEMEAGAAVEAAAEASELATRPSCVTSNMGESLTSEGGRHVRAWAVDLGEDGDETDGEGGVRVAVAAATAQADGVQAPESRAVGPGSGVSDSRNAALAVGGDAEDAPSICNDYMVGEGEVEFCAGGSSESWEGGHHLSSASAFRGWGPFEGKDDDGGGGGGDDGGVMKVRRSFSNLETARRSGADFVGGVAGDDAESHDGEGGGGRRPRALSLDGWFACNLANSKLKSYASHDHTSRLRELVQLPTFPFVDASLSQEMRAIGNHDFATTVQQLSVTFNVSVGGPERKHMGAGARGSVRGVGVDFGVSGKGQRKCLMLGEESKGDFDLSASEAREMSALSGATGGRASKGEGVPLLADSATASRCLDVFVS